MPLEDSELEDILDLMLEPNADDETPEGSARNYRTLVLHDSTFQYRIDRARKALNQWRDKHALRERISEVDRINGMIESTTLQTASKHKLYNYMAQRKTELQGRLNALEGKDETTSKQRKIRSFVATDWYEVKGRGTFAAISQLAEDEYDPNNFMHQEVLIDGKRYKVKGVESFAIPRSRNKPYKFGFGLLV